MVARVNDQVIGRKAEEAQKSNKDDEGKNPPATGIFETDLDNTIKTIEENNPGSLKQVLTGKQIVRYAVIQMLYL